VNGDAAASQNGSEPMAEILETTPAESENGAPLPELEPSPLEMPTETE
jgi:hypothetical protein